MTTSAIKPRAGVVLGAAIIVLAILFGAPDRTGRGLRLRGVQPAERRHRRAGAAALNKSGKLAEWGNFTVSNSTTWRSPASG
jgi:hypothetical protein